MRKIINKTFFILEPSLASLSATLLITSIITLASYITVLAHNGSIYLYFFGSNNGQSATQTSNTGTVEFYNTVFKSSRIGDLVDFALCMLVGLIVYVILIEILHGFGAIAEDIDEFKYTRGKRGTLLRYLGERTSLRVIAGITWLLYLIVSIRIIIPFSLLASKAVVTDPHHLASWLYGLLGVLVLVVSMHVHVILFRLMSLRLRIFGTEEVR